MRGTRTFIALPLPRNLAAACLAWIGELKSRGVDARWVTEEELHITLAFLGELKTTEVVETCRQTTRVASQTDSFVLGLNGIGFFPLAKASENPLGGAGPWHAGDNRPPGTAQPCFGA